jgi:hypothetical protein
MAPSGPSTPTPSRPIDFLHAALASEPTAAPASSTVPIEALSLSVIVTAPVETLAMPIPVPIEELSPAVVETGPVEALVKPVFPIFPAMNVVPPDAVIRSPHSGTFRENLGAHRSSQQGPSRHPQGGEICGT